MDVVHEGATACYHRIISGGPVLPGERAFATPHCERVCVWSAYEQSDDDEDTPVMMMMMKTTATGEGGGDWGGRKRTKR